MNDSVRKELRDLVLAIRSKDFSNDQVWNLFLDFEFDPSNIDYEINTIVEELRNNRSELFPKLNGAARR